MSQFITIPAEIYHIIANKAAMWDQIEETSKEYEQYEHHGNTVWVRQDLKGRHRGMCLCWSCKKLDVSNRENNCRIANELYNMCVTHKLVTPVFECPLFEEL